MATKGHKNVLGQGFHKGYVPTKEHRRRIGLTRIGKISSEETRTKISNSNKGKHRGSPSEETRRKISERVKIGMKIVYERIDREVLLLEEQGFRCIPITNVIPDIVAIKDGKVYAIEVEYNKGTRYYKPNYEKYDKNNYRRRFDDVLWLLRKV